jgi:hypothetical protein
MIIKNELEDKIKFKVNNSKYITLKQNEEYNCNVSEKVKIELMNPDITNTKKLLHALLLMPICILLIYPGSSYSLIAYSFFYEFGNINNDECIIVAENEEGCILKKDDNVLDYNRVSRLKTLLLLIFFVAYSFLIYFIIFIIIWKIKS